MHDHCFACGGVFHPATGHLFGDARDVAYCGPCARHFFAWVREHCHPRKFLDFYREAAKHQMEATC